MSESVSLPDRCLEIIDHIVQIILKGKIRSKEQVYQMLLDGVSPGSGEIFERCLMDRMTAAQRQSEIQTDEFKQAKAARSLRALQTIQGEWDRWQQRNQTATALTSAVQQIVAADMGDRLQVWLSITDPNREKPLQLAQWQQMIEPLQQASASLPDEAQADVAQIAQGIQQGLASWQQLEDHLVSWIYDQNRSQLGFEGVPGQRGPWALWAKQVNSLPLQAFFQTLALNQPLANWFDQQSELTLADLVEMTVVLRCLQQGLVAWFDKLVYDSKVGAKLSISTFLAFAVVWSQVGSGASSASILRRSVWTDSSFQVTLQILRTFAQRPYFPLYGGLFASFSGDYLRNALDYLDEPLQRAPGTQEKARILTLLGSSFRAQGQAQRAESFHQQALEIAREAGDRPCEVANLNHLSRTCVAQSQYGEAIHYSQRALILSRQAGDRPGEANALANLGYSEVFQAQQLEQADPDQYEMAIDRLQQGLQLAEKLGDRQSQALCLSSLGIAHVMTSQHQAAIAYLEGGIQTAQFSGDLYLQGVNLAYLAEAQRHLDRLEPAVLAACLSMYLLEQIGASLWRQPAGLLVVLQGQLGTEAFQELLQSQRPQIIALIGVDGYDHLPDLLEFYRD